MGMTLIEKILKNHSKQETVKPGDIIDVLLDVRAARDFGGANVVKNIEDSNLGVDDPTKTFFTFDCNPTGSDQKYAVNQQICRVFARKHNIKVFDINEGIGTHLLMHNGLAYSGSTAVTTDSHANILGAVGAFGQGMGDKDIAAAFANGRVWFKVPQSVKINIHGKRPKGLPAKEIALNLLNKFGANKLLGYSVEIYGEDIDKLTLDERITISSMGTEMGTIIIMFTPSEEILEFSSKKAGREIELVTADEDAGYAEVYDLDFSEFKRLVSFPGKPHGTVNISEALGAKIDSAFIGSCTNGRIEDMRAAAEILKNRKVAPGVVLKIVPSTDQVWKQMMDEKLLDIFKNAGALVSNAGCAGCAAGQVGQNGKGEVTISSGNRNFPGKQGKGEVYLASPAVVAASAVSGCITTPDNIPDEPVMFTSEELEEKQEIAKKHNVDETEKPTIIEGRVWYLEEDNIDTDMIFHNRYLTITNLEEMGQYALDNLAGYEDFAKRAKPGDIIVTHKNFGSGSSRQQAVDCFKALGVQAIIAESFGAIYERNAINAAFPIMTYKDLNGLDLVEGDIINVNLETGKISNKTKNKTIQANPLFDVQLEIYQQGGLF